MGFFDKILDTLGFGSAKAAAPAQKTSDLEPIFVEPPKPSASAAPADAPVLKVEAPKAVAVVDVVAQLEARAAKNAQKLNWRTSIVDLLKLLDIDSAIVPEPVPDAPAPIDSHDAVDAAEIGRASCRERE